MAVGPVDILLRLLGDSRDAVREVDKVGDAATKAEGKVGGLQSRFAGLVSTIRQTGLAAGVITGIAGQADDLLNQITSGRQERAAAGVARAGTRDELEQAFANQVREALLRRSGSPLERLIGRDLSLPGGLFGTGNDPGVERDVVAQEVARLVAGDRARAQALANLGGPHSAAISAELARTARATAFQDELEGRTATTVNVYTGVGDRNAVGREVRAALDSRDRNNGRYVQTSTRR